MDTPNENAKVTIKDASVTETKTVVPGDDYLTDAKGRRLKIKTPDLLFESRIVRMMGESSSNQAYMFGYVMPAVQVVEIDGDAVPFPTTMLQVEALIARLGREGLGRVMEHHTSEMQKAIDDRAEQDLKN